MLTKTQLFHMRMSVRNEWTVTALFAAPRDSSRRLEHLPPRTVRAVDISGSTVVLSPQSLWAQCRRSRPPSESRIGAGAFRQSLPNLSLQPFAEPKANSIERLKKQL